MKHSAIFSLQACLTALSFKPPIELRRKSGAQEETMRQNMRHDENPVLRLLGWPLAEAEARSVGGFMRGTVATPRSGFVRVFARRMVAPEGGGCRVVGIGTSVKS